MAVDREKLWTHVRARAIIIELLCEEIKTLATDSMPEEGWLPIAQRFARIFVDAEAIGIQLSEYITENNLDPEALKDE